MRQGSGQTMNRKQADQAEDLTETKGLAEL
jgi:hypothetical protein